MKKSLVFIWLALIATIAIAGTTTTNYGLYKPSSGEKNWATQVNQNFDTIDSTVKSVSNVASAAVTDAELSAGLALKVNTSSVGVASGVASLGSDGKIPSGQLPSSLAGALIYKGVLDASGGVYPGSPEQGFYYVISVAGTIDGTAYVIGDWAVYNGTGWDKIDNSASSSGWSVGGGTVQLLDTGNDVVIGSTLDVTGEVSAGSFTGNITGDVTGNADTSTTAGALTANGANCSAGSYPLGVGADGAVESCTDATTEIDSAIATHAGLTTTHGAVSTNTASRIVVRDASGNFSAGTITAALVGNSSTATGLAANPSDCTAGQYASSIDAGGNLTCSTPSSSISGLTTNYVTKASSATGIANSQIFDNGTNVGIGDATPGTKLEVNGTVTATAFVGALTGNATTATALAANGTNCSAGYYPIGVDAAGAAENCTDASTFAGTVTAAAIAITGIAERWAGNTYPANYIDFNDSSTAVTVSTELTIAGVTGSGKAVCVKADGNLGVCSDAVGASGTCTCG